MRALAHARLLLRRLQWRREGRRRGLDGHAESRPFVLPLPDRRRLFGRVQPAVRRPVRPNPLRDPWWKILLVIIAIESDDRGRRLRGRGPRKPERRRRHRHVDAFGPERPEDAANDQPGTHRPGSVDVAVVTLNGNRGLTPAMFTVLDAASDEASTNPIQMLGGKIDTPGTILTNARSWLSSRIRRQSRGSGGAGCGPCL